MDNDAYLHSFWITIIKSKAYQLYIHQDFLGGRGDFNQLAHSRYL